MPVVVENSTCIPGTGEPSVLVNVAEAVVVSLNFSAVLATFTYPKVDLD